MALTFLGTANVPNYVCLSTDILANAVAGASTVGYTIFITDTAQWKIIKSDLTLADYVLPVSFEGSVDVGGVHIDQQITESTALAPFFALATVPTPGVAVPLLSSSTYVMSVTILPIVGNIGTVYVGTSTVDKITSQQIIIPAGGGAVSIDAPLGFKIDLHTFYVDADNQDEGIKFIYLK